MKLLQDILYKSGIEDVIGQTNIAIEKVTFDSRTAEKFSLFIAVRGTQVDGHDFIEKALQQGSLAIICEEFPAEPKEGVTYVKVKDSAYALGVIAGNFYDNPSAKLKLVGVTGTNGKTTTVTLLHNLFLELGYHVGLLSTVVNKIDSEQIPATHTTPDPIQLNALLAEMVIRHCTHCFIEVSSHAIVQHRITGLTFAGGVFTNISHEHLDYHKTFDEYIKAKKQFFDNLPKGAFALVNHDDLHGEVMLQNTKAKKKNFALRSAADFKCKIIENQFTGLQLNIDGSDVWTKLIGGFNAYNVLAVYATAMLLNEEKLATLTAISNFDSVEGRFQYVKTGKNITGIVDYAHTPDALKNVLLTIADIRTGNEKVITICGCGGDRDATKRPLMAKIACELSDRVILTSDNPRTEDPEKIINEMQKGVDGVHFKKTTAITNRKEAIKMACSISNEGDIILVAGKGHEKYQEINGVRNPFDDMEILKQMLETVS